MNGRRRRYFLLLLFWLLLLFACMGLTAEAHALDPLETGAKGSFEILPRLDPARPIPGEDLFLRITIRAIKPYESGPHPPGLVELAADADSGFAGKFRVKALERENPDRIPESAVGSPGTVWTFDYQLTPIRQLDGSYPGEVPEFGLVTTRTDVPWPRLARQFAWLGPFPLRYGETAEGPVGPLNRPHRIPWWLGFALVGALMLAIAVWEGALWRRSVRHEVKCLKEANGAPKVVRDLFYRWLVSRSVVLPAEPIPAQIGRQVASAGYSRAVAEAAEEIWSDLNRARFGRQGIDPADLNSLALRVGQLIGNWSWVPWKRRLGYGMSQTMKMEQGNVHPP